MKTITKDTKVFCDLYNFFGSIEELKRYVSEQNTDEQYWEVAVRLCNKEPFMTVNEEWLIDLIDREVEMQGYDNERSSDHGDEMEKVSKTILEHITIDYKSIMDKMPKLYYTKGREIQINLNDF